MNTVDAVFVMQMVRRCESRSADVSDRLALLNSAANTRFACIFGHVCIKRCDVATMLQNDGVAVAILDAAMDDLAVARRFDWRTAWCGVINSPMRANCIQDRMTSFRIEIGADACEVDRCPDERLAYAETIGCKVIRATGIVDKSHSAIRSTIVIEFSDDNLTVGNELSDFLIL